MSDRITVRMTPIMLAAIDAWISRQPEPMSRQEAVRRCVQVVVLRVPESNGNNTPSGLNALGQEAEDQVVWLNI